MPGLSLIRRFRDSLANTRYPQGARADDPRRLFFYKKHLNNQNFFHQITYSTIISTWYWWCISISISIGTVGRLKVQMIRLMLISIDVIGMIAICMIIHFHKRAILDHFERATRSILNSWLFQINFFFPRRFFSSLVRPICFLFVLTHWSNIVLFAYRTKKEGVYALASFLLSFAMRTLNRRAVRETRKKKNGRKKRKHGRASDEWKGTITHPIASSAHTYTRTRRAHYLWFYLQNADFSKQTTTNGRKPSSTVLFCCARSDPALHARTH